MQDKTLIWDLPVRAFHWTLATSFAGAWLLADGERLRNIHVMFGYTVLGLVAFRLIWGFCRHPLRAVPLVHVSPARDGSLRTGTTARRSARITPVTTRPAALPSGRY